MRSTRTVRPGNRIPALLALSAAVTVLAFSRPSGSAARPQQAAPYTEKLPAAMITMEMMPVPAGAVQTASGRQNVGAFWMMKTEVPWEAYDVYVFSLDRAASSGAVDAVARPSKPYVLPGDQFGHTGHPALGMTFQAAEQFAQWITAHSGKVYRLPTEAEWERACRAGNSNGSSSDDAWFRDNSARRTHRVGTKPANALGLHDLLGNAGEWVRGTDGPVVKGGAWNSPGSEVSCSARLKQTPAWNATDPNLPKSTWWLSDAPFVGFRLVREP